MTGNAPGSRTTRTFSHAGLGNTPCYTVARKSALIRMVSHALPRMQCALAGAKRLECGSLLPLCISPQATCLEPDPHDSQNNVSVPISASEGFLHRLRQPRTGKMGNLRTTPESGGRTQTTSLSLYLGPHPDNGPVTLSDSLPKAVLL